MPLLSVSFALCACGSNEAHTSSSPARKVVGTVKLRVDASPEKNPTALRTYLRVWQVSWRSLARGLQVGSDDDFDFSNTPDESWDRAQRYYGKAASAYRLDERRLAAISPPRLMRAANNAYTAAVRRQATRFQKLSDAFAGTDPGAMERALEALERSQLKFDLDGARWERAVIAACKATGVEVPEIVRREYVSNGQRTR
jgi:hypothetical protein